jgi:hypothetical protein
VGEVGDVTDGTPRRLEDIPLSKLRADRLETIEDIALCKRALKAGVTHYLGGRSVQERLDGNKRILGIIEGLIADKDVRVLTVK